jgi:hypothetical protein
LATPYLKLTTMGIPLGGQAVKHRQLARQVGVRIEDSPANSMASFKFTSAVLPKGMAFIFGSWVCVADGVGYFRRHTIDIMKPKTLVGSFHSKLDEFIDNLDELLIHGSTRKIEEESVFNAAPPRAATTTLGSDSLQSEDLRSRSRLGPRNSATELREANNSESLSVLEKDLDFLLQIRKPEATAQRGAVVRLGDNSESGHDTGPSLSRYNGLMITSTLEGRFVHWKGMKLFDLLEDEDRLMAQLEPLPFQEGKPLATMAEESTELVKATSDELILHQVLMAKEGEDDGLSPNETLDMISEDEATATASNKNEIKREARRARNRARTARRKKVNERIRSMHRELDAEFAIVSERGFRTLVANIARVTTILERSNDPNLRQALHYAQRAWI